MDFANEKDRIKAAKAEEKTGGKYLKLDKKKPNYIVFAPVITGKGKTQKISFPFESGFSHFIRTGEKKGEGSLATCQGGLDGGGWDQLTTLHYQTHQRTRACL